MGYEGILPLAKNGVIIDEDFAVLKWYRGINRM